ncbi:MULTISPECIES: non-ribosomal peptide synthetase [Actinomadura]|uniref:Non-ribosomal peptide synthetase n=1 Tax=Actinomadura yumaensis TaxID=111807 RepID=A0ABW2CD87_9ACTN|nr:non-ribosomal peptide synthetase [Actinomadura sp. J1-007]MWK38139.1 amino acid adenylation domain-containing protein [Actinomadura sp. J1-007]
MAAPEAPFVHRAVAARAAASPDRIAVECGDARLSYAELWERAGRVAALLRAEGVGPDTVVAVAMERSAELPVALLGVLAAGGAYVPLDLDHPARRREFVLADSGARVVLTQERFMSAVPREAATVVTLDGFAGAPRPAGAAAPPAGCADPHPDSLAYVIHTSGSTGTPKAAMNTHRAIANRLAWMQDAYGLTRDDRVLQKTPLSFDVSVWELFWPLMNGARLVLARPGGHRDPAYLVEAVRARRVTTLHFVPAMLRAFLAAPGVEECASLRRVVSSGEALPPDLAERFFQRLPGVDLHNLYGPTEAAVDVTAWTCRKGDAAVPIGAPIANVRAYVVDERMAPAGPGEPGELLVGGVALARGYLGRPALTAERFVPDHLSGEPGARLYRTGDRARWRDDGTLEFLGRLDDQVKIRGVRVEPGEAAAVLAGHAGVAGATVLARPGPGGEPRLVAYAVPDEETARPVAGLLRAEREGLPVPAVRHDLPDGRTVLVPNRTEAEFLAREVFDGERYAELGIDPSPGGVVVDAGAHVGVFALLAARSGATVHAFEPIPPLFELLRRNLAVHGVDARAHPCALGAEDGEATLTHYPHLTIMSGRHTDPGADREVLRAYLGDVPDLDRLLDRSLEERRFVRPVRALSSVLRESGVRRVDLLKIDVERSEEEVVAGVAEADWAMVRQVLVEVHDTGGRLARLTRFFEARGYRVRSAEDPRLAGTGLVMLAAVRPDSATASAATASAGTATAVEPVAAVRAEGGPWASPALLTADLRAHAARSLPDALVPSAFVLLDAFPLTPNGKIDRAALPEPPSRPRLSGIWTPPEGPAQERLAALWSELLGQDKPGADDDFFELGGHSLLANRLVARIRAEFGVELPLDEVFTARTVRGIASAIGSAPPAGREVPRLVPVPREGRLPLSYSQERLWFLQQLHPGIRAYQFQATIELTGTLDAAALARALTEIVRRHEIYRTTFTEAPGVGEASGAAGPRGERPGPRQVIHPPFPAPLAFDDLSGGPDPEGAARALIRAAIAETIPVDRLPLVRWRLLRTAPDRHVLLHLEHHLVHDGWAFNTFVGELAALYGAYATGGPSPLPEPEVQFADFAVWQRSWLDGAVSERQLAYWREALDGVPLFLDLPTDRPRTPERRFLGDAPRFELPAEVADRTRALAAREGVTLFTAMLAAFEVLMCHWSGQDDFCVGSGFANRRWRQTERLLGMVINTVPLRADLRGDPTFRELLARTRAAALGAHANQDVPYDRVVAAMRPERVAGRHPLCQVSFAFHDAPMPPLRMPGLDVRVTPGIANGTAKFDLNVIAIPAAEQAVGQDGPGGPGGPGHAEPSGAVEFIWEYDRDLFDARTIARAAELYRRLLDAVTGDPEARVSELLMGVP